MEVTQSFLALLQEFAGVFTKPTFQTFVLMITGWYLSHRRRFVTELIQSSDSTHNGHHSGYHRFFSDAAWCLDALFMVLARMLVSLLAPAGFLELAVDDTLCRHRGLTIYGTGMHHDPLISSRALKLVSWGHDWVVVCLLVRCPWAPTKVWALPIACRLYRNKQGNAKAKKRSPNEQNSTPVNHRTRPQLAVALLEMLARWFPERILLVTGDSAYGGKSVLQHLPKNVELISHVHPKGALYAPATPNAKGRPRKKGERLPTMAQWAEDGNDWQTLTFDQFGLHATLQVKTRQALYYKAGKDRLLTIVLVRDALGKRPDQMFYCTHLQWDARTILSTYACRWAIEVTFENCKQLLGLEDPANRKPKAVERTAPVALVLYSLIVLWFHLVGHLQVRFPDRPWYKQKSEPSFADMLSTLRRLTWEETFRPLHVRSGPLKNLVDKLIDFSSRAA